MEQSTIDIIKILLDVAIVPAIGAMWAMNGRLSKIEAQLSILLKKTGLH